MFFVGGCARCPSLLAPQDFKPVTSPVSDTVRQLLVQHSQHLIASAELMPAEQYTYRPTEAR